MNTPLNLAPTTLSGLAPVGSMPGMARGHVPVSNRADLPVVSNRAFIRSWMARRATLAAKAQSARRVGLGC